MERSITSFHIGIYLLILIFGQGWGFDFHDYDLMYRQKERFRQLEINDSVEYYVHHQRFAWSIFEPDMTTIVLRFIDKYDVEVIEFSIHPRGGWFGMQCYVGGKRFGEEIYKYYKTSSKKSYRFKFVFAEKNLMLFFGDEFWMEHPLCAERNQEIAGFTHGVDGEIFGGYIKVNVIDRSDVVPADWRIKKHLPLNHIVAVEYYIDNSDKTGDFIIRLVDLNDIAALTVNVSYSLAHVFVKRDRYDEEFVDCINFGNSYMFTKRMMNRVSIYLDAYQYRVTMRVIPYGTEQCVVFGHHSSPYDIEQVILDSTKYAIAIRYYLYEKSVLIT